jgi:hypothetical protein
MLHVSTNIDHLQVSLKSLMKLLGVRPLVQFLGYALVYAAMCPTVMGSSPYCVVCSCYECFVWSKA